MAKLLSNRLIQELDGNGAPYAGAKLFTYQAGTSTKEPTYQDEDSSTAHANPIILDANGRIPAGVWLTEGQGYKLLLAPSDDTDPPVSPIWTLDDVTGLNDFTIGGLDQWVASGLTPTYISGTQFSVPGDVTSAFHVGRRLKITDAGGTKYAYITATAFVTVTTVTVSVDAGGSLSTPTSAVSYGVDTTDNPSRPLLTDAFPIVSGSADKTKKLRLEVDGLTTATTRVITVPDADLTIPAVTTKGDIVAASAANVLARVAVSGTDGDVLIADSAAASGVSYRTKLTLATPQVTTSGTAFDFTSISSWAKRVTVMFNEVSLTGTDNLLVQIGDSGDIENTGYVSSGGLVITGGVSAVSSATDGFIIRVASAAFVVSGHMVLTHIGSNLWICSYNGKVSTGTTFVGGGSKTLSDTLDRVRITRTGTDTFDAGSVTVMWE